MKTPFWISCSRCISPLSRYLQRISPVLPAVELPSDGFTLCPFMSQSCTAWAMPAMPNKSEASSGRIVFTIMGGFSTRAGLTKDQYSDRSALEYRRMAATLLGSIREKRRTTVQKKALCATTTPTAGEQVGLSGRKDFREFSACAR